MDGEDEVNFEDITGEESMDDSIDENTAKELLVLNRQLNQKTEAIQKKTKQLLEQKQEELKEPIRTIPAVSGPSTASRTPNKLKKDKIRPPASVNPNNPEEQDDEIDTAAKDMAPEAMSAFYKARVRVLNKELKTIIEELKQTKSKIDTIQQESTAKDTEQQQMITNLKKTNEKKDKQIIKLQQQLATLEIKLQNAKKDALTAKPKPESGPSSAAGRPASTEATVSAARYQRALEENDTQKQKIQELQHEIVNNPRLKELEEKNSKLNAQLKLRERQQNELLKAFKKQVKLIDILKRQKIHLEATKLLQFTEDEFQKTLSFGNELKK